MGTSWHVPEAQRAATAGHVDALADGMVEDDLRVLALTLVRHRLRRTSSIGASATTFTPSRWVTPSASTMRTGSIESRARRRRCSGAIREVRPRGSRSRSRLCRGRLPAACRAGLMRSPASCPRGPQFVESLRSEQERHGRSGLGPCPARACPDQRPQRGRAYHERMSCLEAEQHPNHQRPRWESDQRAPLTVDECTVPSAATR